MVIEVFGFSPRAGLPDVCVHTFGSRAIYEHSLECVHELASRRNWMFGIRARCDLGDRYAASQA